MYSHVMYGFLYILCFYCYFVIFSLGECYITACFLHCLLCIQCMVLHCSLHTVFSFLAHSNELMQWRGVRPSICPFVCKLLRKSLLLADKWPDRHQTCTQWTPGQCASRVRSRSRSRDTGTFVLARKSLLAGKWLDRDQTCTRWSPAEFTSRVCLLCSNSRSR